MTESGVNFSLDASAPAKKFHYVNNENCNCSECPYMRLNTLEKLRDALLYLEPRVELQRRPDAPRAAPHPADAGREVSRYGQRPLIDNFGRLHDSLRISVTDRCNIRCFYCMPEDGVEFMRARQDILSFEEIERFVRVAARWALTSCVSPAANRCSARSAGAHSHASRRFPAFRISR